MTNIFLISKELNVHLVPWIYRTTTFQFGTAGFTNFMRFSGPSRRALITKVALSFHTYALVHCIRWFTPDPIFTLFDPIVSNMNEPALQYLWRCEIQDLASELSLRELVIDVQQVATDDIPIIAHLLRRTFRSVDRVTFVDGEGLELGRDDKLLEGLKLKKTWREYCEEVFQRYRQVHYHNYMFGKERRAWSEDDLVRELNLRCEGAEKAFWEEVQLWG